MTKSYRIETIKMLTKFREKNQDIWMCAYKAFIEPLQIGEISDEQVILVSPLKAATEHVSKKYSQTLKEILGEIIGRECGVLVVDTEAFLARKRERRLQFIVPEPINIKEPFICKFLGQDCLLLLETASFSEKKDAEKSDVKSFDVPKEYESFFEEYQKLELFKVSTKQETFYLICPCKDEMSTEMKKVWTRFFIMNLQCSAQGEIEVVTRKK